VDVVAYSLPWQDVDTDSSRFLAAVVPQLAYLLDEDPEASRLNSQGDVLTPDQLRTGNGYHGGRSGTSAARAGGKGFIAGTRAVPGAAFQRSFAMFIVRGDSEKVTNQVTTASGNGRRSLTRSDSSIPLICGNPTQPDRIRRNRYAW